MRKGNKSFLINHNSLLALLVYCDLMEEFMPSNCGAGEDSREFLGQQGDQTSQP